MRCLRSMHRFYGSPLSPYSIKSYLKFKEAYYLIIINTLLSSVELLHLVKYYQNDYSLFE
jgi:hypothetical protein